MAHHHHHHHAAQEASGPHPWGPRMRIGKVYIKGNKRTKAEVFEHELQEAYEADRIGYIVEGLRAASEGLSALDIFEEIDFQLDKASSGRNDETDVIISVKEKGWRKLHVGATTDGSEETAETSCTLVNALGQAEKIKFAASYAYSGSNTERATIEKPRFLGLPLYFHASASNELHNHERLCSYNEKIRGGFFSVSDYGGFHELSLNLGWRDIIPRRDAKIPTAFRASPSVIAEAMPSTKASIKYVFKDDTRNNPVLPTSGGLFQYSTEIAGLVGDVRFVKAEVAAQKHVGIGPHLFGHPILNFSFATHLGAIKSYGSDEHRPTRLSDRFFLGGPLSVRGFHHKGVGPRASPNDGGVKSGDALGGDVSYTAFASMGFPCPFPLLAMLGMRGHIFANAGNLTTWSRLLNEKKWMKHLVDDTRVSVGVGIVWGTSIGRIEANYSWVLKSHQHDNVKRSQIGLGMTFT
ncbi:hypothetical protein ATCC90586_008763 [Pythium insidiosum]|nr:hypothetical protein ATCC90586_008763 [Pythium insidiosum]